MRKDLNDFVPITDIVDTSHIVQLVAEYRLPNLVPCSIATCHQLHKHGYVAEMEDGTFGRVGHNCRDGLLKTKLAVLVRDLHQRQTREQRLRFVSNPLFDPSESLKLLDDWKSKVKRLQSSRTQLKRVLGRAHEVVVRAYTSANQRVPGAGFFEMERYDRAFHDTLGDVKAAAVLHEKSSPSDENLQRMVTLSDRSAGRLEMIARIMEDASVLGDLALNRDRFLALLNSLDDFIRPSVEKHDLGVVFKRVRTDEGYVLSRQDLLIEFPSFTLSRTPINLLRAKAP